MWSDRSGLRDRTAPPTRSDLSTLALPSQLVYHVQHHLVVEAAAQKEVGKTAAKQGFCLACKGSRPLGSRGVGQGALVHRFLERSVDGGTGNAFLRQLALEQAIAARRGAAAAFHPGLSKGRIVNEATGFQTLDDDVDEFDARPALLKPLTDLPLGTGAKGQEAQPVGVQAFGGPLSQAILGATFHVKHCGR